MNVTASSRGDSSDPVEGQFDDPLAHLLGNAVPNPLRPWAAVFEGIDTAAQEPVIPEVEGGARYTEFLQRTACRQVRLLDEPDDLQLLP